jgi:hypothetical protein
MSTAYTQSKSASVEQENLLKIPVLLKGDLTLTMMHEYKKHASVTSIQETLNQTSRSERFWPASVILVCRTGSPFTVIVFSLCPSKIS